MTKLTINGEELTISFNLATEIAYADLTGKDFNPTELFDEQGNTTSSDAIKIALASLIANNPDSQIDEHYILYEAPREEITRLVSLVFMEMFAWLKVPAIAEAHVPESATVPADSSEGSQEEDNHPND